MTINDQIRDEKLQYDINREAAKISALSSGKIHKYEYLTGEDILTSNHQQIIDQAKFNSSPIEKQIKTIEDKDKKLVDALKSLKAKKNNQNRSRINIIISQKLQLHLMILLTKVKKNDARFTRQC